MRKPLPCTISVLEAVGFKFAVDYDKSLIWEAPESIDVAALTPIVEEWSELIALGLIARQSRERRRCYGGPLDGRRHGWMYRRLPLLDQSGKFVRDLENFMPVRVNRAKWACYRLMSDGRAFFVGYATSERRARHGEANYQTKAAGE